MEVDCEPERKAENACGGGDAKDKAGLRMLQVQLCRNMVVDKVDCQIRVERLWATWGGIGATEEKGLFGVLGIQR